MVDLDFHGCYFPGLSNSVVQLMVRNPKANHLGCIPNPLKKWNFNYLSLNWCQYPIIYRVYGTIMVVGLGISFTNKGCTRFMTTTAPAKIAARYHGCVQMLHCHAANGVMGSQQVQAGAICFPRNPIFRREEKPWLGGGNSNAFRNFHPENLGKMNPFFTSIFFRWVETTNQFKGIQSSRENQWG